MLRLFYKVIFLEEHWSIIASVACILTILLFGCIPKATQNLPTSTPIITPLSPKLTSTPILPSLSPEPTSTPILHFLSPEPTTTQFVKFKSDFESSWDIYDSNYFSTHCILTIRRLGSKYTEKLECPDGSNGNYDLTAISEGKEIELTGHLGITSSLYGDYMVIDSRGWLVFNDDQGYIYSVPPFD